MSELSSVECVHDVALLLLPPHGQVNAECSRSVSVHCAAKLMRTFLLHTLLFLCRVKGCHQFQRELIPKELDKVNAITL